MSRVPIRVFHPMPMVPSHRHRRSHRGASSRCRTRERLRSVVLALAALAGAAGTSAAETGVAVPMERAPSGNYYVHGVVEAGVEADFLVDTGSGLVTFSRSLFRSVPGSRDLRSVRRVAARLADGRTHVVDVYELPHLRLGDGCDLGPVEVAVLAGEGANILGMSALGHAAPFSFHTEPPALVLGHCR